MDQGFDELESIACVTREQLQDMKVLPGHANRILRRALELAEKYPGKCLSAESGISITVVVLNWCIGFCATQNHFVWTAFHVALHHG